ncbi:MAG: hypothetical protein RL135_1540 [Bacteroidota bacterium]|jgi:hypothetical protein
MALKKIQNMAIAADAVTPEMIESWKQQYGGVFRYTTEDGKIAYFKTPDRKILGMSTSAPDVVAGNEIVARNCFLAGDECVINEDQYFFGLQNQLSTFLKQTTGKSEEL